MPTKCRPTKTRNRASEKQRVVSLSYFFSQRYFGPIQFLSVGIKILLGLNQLFEFVSGDDLYDVITEDEAKVLWEKKASNWTASHRNT